MAKKGKSKASNQKKPAEYKGMIIIDDGNKTVSLDVVGKSTNELYDTFKFIRDMKKTPGKYRLDLKIEE